MLYKTLSAAVYVIDASIIEVEVDVSGTKQITTFTRIRLSIGLRGQVLSFVTIWTFGPQWLKPTPW